MNSNNRILIIHTDSETVDYDIFRTIYDGMDYDVIDSTDISDDNLRDALSGHDKIVFLGGVFDEGLMVRDEKTGKYFLLINDTHLDLLKDKQVYSIGGKRYFSRHGIKGFHTGTILTSAFEACLYEIDASEEEVLSSVMRFVTIMRYALETHSPVEMRARLLEEYTGTDSVTQFNREAII